MFLSLGISKRFYDILQIGKYVGFSIDTEKEGKYIIVPSNYTSKVFRLHKMVPSSLLLNEKETTFRL